jgi:hypothetical protein
MLRTRIPLLPALLVTMSRMSGANALLAQLFFDTACDPDHFISEPFVPSMSLLDTSVDFNPAPVLKDGAPFFQSLKIFHALGEQKAGEGFPEAAILLGVQGFPIRGDGASPNSLDVFDFPGGTVFGTCITGFGTHFDKILPLQ